MRTNRLLFVIEMTRWHLKNYNCKQILLGIAHDSGYAPFLDEILRDDATKQRVTVIEGVPVVQDLLSTGVEVLDLEEDLFRRDKLEERVTRYPNSRQVNRSTESAISTSKGAPVAVQSISRLETPPPDHNVPKSPLVSYANPSGSSLAAAEPPPKITMPLTRVMSGPSVAKNGGRISQEASWVAGLRRVDKKYNVANEILESIRKRKEYNKLCNHYFLQNKCPKGIGCPFVHDYSTTKEELNAIRVVARVNPCTFGQDCEDMQCFYGHHVSFFIKIHYRHSSLPWMFSSANVSRYSVRVLHRVGAPILTADSPRNLIPLVHSFVTRVL